MRDLEYDWQTLVENVADPSHVPFTHHGVQGNREKARPIPLKITKSTPELIQAHTSGAWDTKITFQPPCRLEYEIKIGNTGKQVGLVTYCLPVSPGKCRIVAQFPRNFAQKLQRLVPRWWTHVKTRNQVLDGDMIVLHQQENFLQQTQYPQVWKTVYKLPTSADRLVIEFREWLDKYCHGQLPWKEVGIDASEYVKINPNREELLDRYKQHTIHCSSCRDALKNLQRLQIGLLLYFAIAIAFVAILPDGWRLQVGLPVILGLGGYGWLKFWLIPRFYFIDYIHPEK